MNHASYSTEKIKDWSQKDQSKLSKGKGKEVRHIDPKAQTMPEARKKAFRKVYNILYTSIFYAKT